MKFIIIVFLKSDWGKICLKFRTLNCSIQCILLSEVMFDSEEDDRTDINEIVHEALVSNAY